MGAILDAEQERWVLQGAVTMTVASCNAERVPSIAQAIGCRFEDGRRRIRLLMLEPRNRATVADLRAGQALAIVFTHGVSTRSLQVKAARAVEVPLAPGDADCVSAYLGSLLGDWGRDGVPEPYTRALFPREPGPLLAFEFEPEAAFDQTPGPRAGTLLPGAA